MSAAAIVGRDRVLAELSAAAAAVESDGRGRARVVAGPPGIGKSTVARTLAASLGGWTVIVGRCAPAPSVPRRALTEVAVAAISAGADFSALRDTVFGAAVHSLLASSSATAEATRQDLMTAEGLLRLVATCPDEPALVVVEDLQWADDETLAVVDYLFDHLASARTLWLLTTREAESPVADSARADWARRGVADTIVLPPFDRPAVTELLNRIVGADVPEDFADAVLAASEGNPLLVEEFARQAVESGTLRSGPDGWQFDTSQRLAIPPSYRAAVSRRVEALPEELRPVMQLAALCGRVLDPSRLERLGVASAVVRDAAAAGLRAQILEKNGEAGGSLEFRHALTRDAVAWSVTEASRQRLAADALTALRESGDLDDTDLEVASRLADAAGDRREACSLLVEAATRAVASGATATALTRLDSADAVADADLRHGPEIRELRVRALAQAGRALEALRIGEELVTTLSSVEERSRRDRVVVALARASGSIDDWPAAAHRLDAGFGDLTDAPPEALSFRAIAAIEMGDVDTARALASRSLELNAQGATLCEAHEVLGRVARESSYVQAADHFRAGVEAATTAGLGLWRARSLLELGLCEATVYGRPDVFEEARRRAVECGALSLAAMVDYNLANLRCFLYDARAAETAERGVATARHLGAAKIEAMCWVVVAQAHATFGRRARSRVAADEARRVAPDDPEIEGLAVAAAALGDLVLGDLAASVDGYAHGMRLLADLPVPTATGAWYTGPVVLAVVGHDLAIEMRTQLAEPSFTASPYLLSCGDLIDAVVSGQAGDAESAGRHHAAAMARFETHPDIAERFAGHRHVLAAAVAAPARSAGWGDPVGDLQRAEAFFSSQGIEGPARWCTGLLREAGVGPRKRGRGRIELPGHLAPYGITKREHDVLMLLGARLTNREIADELTVSPATVKSHVERLLAKTGLRSRVELGELARVDGGA